MVAPSDIFRAFEKIAQVLFGYECSKTTEKYTYVTSNGFDQKIIFWIIWIFDNKYLVLQIIKSITSMLELNRASLI